MKTCAVTALALTWASMAGAQTTASLEELKALGSAKTVTLIDTQAQEFQGTIADASDSLLSLRIGNQIRRFPVTEIRTVYVRREDSLKNGALIGAAVSGGLSSLMFLDNECHDDPVCYKAVATYTAAGALAGLAIDALIRGTTVVYRARSQPQLSVMPIAGVGRRGVELMIRF
jgi:hypothetical protein